MAGANINFKIGYTVDKSGLKDVENSLRSLQKMGLNEYMDLNRSLNMKEANSNLNELKSTIASIRTSFANSFNSSLGSFNTAKLNNDLQKIGIDKIYTQFKTMGASGETAFRMIASEALSTNLKLKDTRNLLDEMADTFASTVKWNIASSAMNALQRNVQAAYNYVVKLDSSLNDIRVVTGKSADDMERFAQRATDAAKELSASTRDITEGALIYYQQGDSDADALAKAKITQKAANVSQIDTADASEYLTAVWNGYQVANQAAEEGMQVYEEYVDKLAAVAATTASDLEESSVAMSKVASAANAMGVDFDQLNAQIATIVSVTRQAPESVGTALKTIYARMGDLSIEGGTDEFGVSLGEVSGQLEQVGIHILDENSNLRDMGTVIEEVAAKWQNWTEAQQQSVAIAIAGKRQYNNLISLFNSWDMYTDALNTSKNAMGTLQEQQDIYEERTTAHIQELTTAFEDLYDSAWDSDVFKGVVDTLTGIINIFSSFVDSIGGGSKALLYFGSVATSVFNKQISKNITSLIQNHKDRKNNDKLLNQDIENTKNWAKSQGAQDVVINDAIKRQKDAQKYYKTASPEEINNLNNINKELTQAKITAEAWKQKLNEVYNFYTNFSEKGKVVSKEDFFNTKGAKAYADMLKNISSLLTKINTDTVQADLKSGNYHVGNRRQVKANYNSAIKELFGNAINLKNNYADVLSKEVQAQLEAALSQSFNGKGIFNEKGLAGGATQSELLMQAFDEKGDLQESSEAGQKLKEVLNFLIESIEAARQEILEQVNKAKNTRESEAPDNPGQMSQTDQNQANVDDLERRHTEAEDPLDTQKKVAAYTSLASGAMQAISLMTTINSLYDTWRDKDVSTGTKITQTFQAIGGQILGILPNIDNLKTSFETLGESWGMSAGQVAGAMIGVTAAVGLFVFAINQYEQAAREKLENLRKFRDSIIESNKEAQETEKLYVSYEKAYENYKETGESKTELVSATSELCTALGEEINSVALLADNYDVLNEKIQQNRKEKLESSLNKAVIGKESAERTLKKAAGSGWDDSTLNLGTFTNGGIDEQVAEYLQEAFQEAGITGAGATEAARPGDVRTLSIKNLNDLDDFGDAFSVLVDVYSKIGNDIEGVQSSQLYEKIGELISDNQEDWDKLLEATEQVEDFATGYTQTLLASNEGLDIKDIDSLSSFEKYRNKFIEILSKQRGYQNKSSDELADLTDNYLKSFDNTAKYVESLDLENKIKDALYDGSETTKEVVDDFLKQIEENNEFELLATLTIDKDSSLEEIKAGMAWARKNAELSMPQSTIDSINNLAEFYNRDESKKITKSEQESFDAAEAEIESYLKQKEGIDGLKSAWDEWQIVKEKGTLTQIEYLQDLEAQDEQYAQKTAANYRESAQLEQEYLKTRLENLEKLKEEEAYDDVEDKISKYQKLMEEQGEAFDDSSSEAKDLFESSEAFEKAKDRMEELTSATEELSIQLNEVNEKLSSGDFEFDASMGNVDEILSIGDTILSQSEKIQSAAELIGEGYKVSAEDAEQLLNILPAILDNAENLADGTIQLSKETVQSVLGDQSAILNGDTATAEAKIQNQIDVLEAQAAEAQAELDLARAIAEGKTQLSKEEIEYIAMGQNALVQELMNNGVEENDAWAATLAAMSGNMDSFNTYVDGKASAQADSMARAWAHAATEQGSNVGIMVGNLSTLSKAVRDAMNGNEVSGSTTGGFFNKYVSSYADKINKVWSKTNDVQYGDNIDTGTRLVLDDWMSSTQSRLDQYNKAIAKLKILRGKLITNQKNAQAALQGAASGAGGKKDTGKGSGSEGSGKDSEKEADHIDQLEDEADTYHDIDLEISQIETSLKRLQDRQEKLSGKDLIDNLNKQLEVLEKQKKAYQDKIELARMELGVLKEALAAQGVTFASDGYISNYYSALQAKLNHTNEVIAKYNNMSATEQEAFKETVEQAKEDYENFKDQIESYDKLISDTIPDLEDQIQEATDKQIELQIKKFTMEIEVRLEMAEAERKFNEFKTKVIDGLNEDDILGKTKQSLDDLLSYFNTNKTGTGPIQSLTDQLNGTLEELKQIEGGGWANNYGDNQAQALEDLKTYYEQLMDQLGEVQDLVDSIKESYLDMIDEAVDAFDKQVDQYEYINDLLAHDIDLIKLLYGEDAYSEMEKYYGQIENNNNKELDFLKKRVAYAYEMMNAETDPEAKEKWQEEWEEALSSLNDKVNDALQNIVDKYVNSINKVFDELNKKVTGGLGLEYVNDEWDLINKNADAYLDTINGMYEIQKLENKYLDAIDQTDNIANQQKLNDLMNEQLSMLKDKEKLTQYDVDRANALYEIALKEIALQDAQQNKSKMRLRRDSQGNYSYQYVSDQDSIAQAQQDLIEAQNSLYNLDKDKYKQNLDSIYSTYSEFQQKLLELYSDQTISAEERQQKEALLVEQYGELINGLVEQNENIKNNLRESAFDSLANMYEVDVDNFKNMSNEEQDILMNSLIPQWESGVQKMTDIFAGDGGFIPSCSEAFDKLKELTKDYQDSLNELESSAGINFDSISSGYDNTISQVENLIDSNDELIDRYNQQIDAIQTIISQMDTLISKYTAAKNEAIAATKAAYGYWQAEQTKKTNTGTGGSASPGTTGSNSSSTTNGSSSGTSGSSSTGTTGSSSNTSKANAAAGGDGVPRVGDVVTYTGGLYYYDSYGKPPTGSRGPGKKVTIVRINEKAPYPIAVKSTDSAYGWLKKSQITGYDTGGYTGDWDDEDGRLALLHKKELVLKDSDTENMLSAVKMVRGMGSLLDSINQSMQNRMSGLLSYFTFATNSISSIPNNSNPLEQNVHIDATFPNATNSKEIEDAFNNLINVASQRAYDNRR